MLYVLLHTTGLRDKIWHAFTILLNVKSVGVIADNRTYDNTVCVRIVVATDGINRVAYDISSKPPRTIKWE